MTLIEVCSIVIASSLVIGLVLPTLFNIFMFIRNYYKYKRLFKISGLDNLDVKIEKSSSIDNPINKDPF